MLKYVTFLFLVGLSVPAFAVCGDTTTDAGEQCDDGNTLDGDGCSATCQVECGFLQSGLINGSLEFPQQAPNTEAEHDETLVPAWFASRTDIAGTLINIHGQTPSIPAKHGNNYASLNIIRRTGIHQYVDVVPGVKIDWSVWYRAEILTTEQIRVFINGQSQGISPVASLTEWQEFTGQYTVPQGVYRMKFQVSGFHPSLSDDGSLVDDISISYPDIPSIADCSTTPNILFQTQASGRIIVVGNSSLSCDGADPNCASARTFGGSAFKNNDFDMTFVDVDGAASTPNSSRASFGLNAGETVAWAGLFWSAGYTDFGRPSVFTAPTNPAARNVVNLRRTGSGPNSTGNVTGTVSDIEGRLYRGFADVTTRVQNSGGGNWFVRNMQATQGPGMSAGWAMVIVTNDASLPSRSLTVADIPFQRHSDRLRFTVPNFSAPYDPGANMEFGYVAWDGDPGVTDFIFLNNNLVQPGTSAFPNEPWDISNSTISNLGVAIGRAPSHANSFGTDVKTLDGSNYIFGSTDMEVELVTSGDQLLPGVMTFQTDLPAAPLAPLSAQLIAEQTDASFDIGSIDIENLDANVDLDDASRNFDLDELEAFAFGCATGSSNKSTWLLIGLALLFVRRRKTIG